MRILKKIADWLVFFLGVLRPVNEKSKYKSQKVQVPIPLGQTTITQIRPSRPLHPRVFKAILPDGQIIAVLQK
jgi:hypothetical protein